MIRHVPPHNRQQSLPFSYSQTEELDVRKIIILAATAALIAGGAAAASKTAAAFKGQELAGQASIDLAHARSLALKARPGRIADEELEKEPGGSGLRYSFDIVSHGKTVEVGIDAKTGKVLENGAESPAKEAKEEASEKPKSK